MLARGHGSRHYDRWTWLVVITGDWHWWFTPVCPAAVLLLVGHGAVHMGRLGHVVGQSHGCSLPSGVFPSLSLL